MAKKTAQSGLAKSLGVAGKKAVKTHASDETDYGQGGQLPEGIEQGIAQLTECKFDKYVKGDMAGQYYFQVRGVVVAPNEHEGIPIEGLTTMLMEPMCDTPTRSRPEIADHVEWVLNEMRKLGADTEGAESSELEALVEALKEEAPYFRFRTWKGDPTDQYPNPRVNHQWGGACDFDPETGEDTDTEDNSDEDEEEEVVATKKKASSKGAAKTKTTKKSTKKKSASKKIDLDSISFSDLAEIADDEEHDQCVEAQEKLTEEAEEAEIDADEHEEWTDLAQALETNSDDEDDETEDDEEEEEEEEDETEEEDEVEPPTKGDTCFYKPPKKRKAVECTVTAVFAKSECCNLKNLADNTVYKKVSWDDLLEE